MPTPLQLITAVLSGWAAADAVHTVGAGHLPTLLVLLLEAAAGVLAFRVALGAAKAAGLGSRTQARAETLARAAAVVAGAAAGWAVHTVGFEIVPTLLVALLVAATVRGTYRRHAQPR